MTSERVPKTTAELEEVLQGISFNPSCVDLDWKWETVYVRETDPGFDAVEGWLIRVGFTRPDTDTGVVARGWGRYEFVPFGTGESGIVKTCWLLAELIVRHELMEAFKYRGFRIFNPHHTIEELTLPQQLKDGAVALTYPDSRIGTQEIAPLRRK